MYIETRRICASARWDWEIPLNINVPPIMRVSVDVILLGRPNGKRGRLPTVAAFLQSVQN
jgi:hypothetical protein